jgi:hypothetical protein
MYYSALHDRTVGGRIDDVLKFTMNSSERCFGIIWNDASGTIIFHEF